MKRLLIANRGEISLRIARAATDLGLAPVAVYSSDDADSAHVRLADEAVALPGSGPAAYLDETAILAAAADAGCDALHPGYGFLSEQASFASACAAAGVTFVGPAPEHLALFGDKARARDAALAADLPILAGTAAGLTLTQAETFYADLPRGNDGAAAMMLKAVAGGGGRGSRLVEDPQALSAAYERCRSEAQAAFGIGDLYAEQYLPAARHIEVQILGDGERIVTFGERDCSVQRRHQKLIELAPAPALLESMRRALIDAARRLGESVSYRGLGTVEFLVRPEQDEFYFIETNARLQVEHTVTELTWGVDLVALQLQVAAGASLATLSLPATAQPGFAIQARVNLERYLADGSVLPAAGTLAVYEPPTGPGVRVDGYGYTGYRTSSRYDALLAKIIVHNRSDELAVALRQTRRALREFRIEGVATNREVLRAVLDHADLRAARVTTTWFDAQLASLLDTASQPFPGDAGRAAQTDAAAAARGGHAGARIDSVDPLALFEHGHGADTGADARALAAAPADSAALTEPTSVPDGTRSAASPIQGTLVSVAVAPGDEVRSGATLAIVEAMKMEHEITAPCSGVVQGVTMTPGDVVRQDYPLVYLVPAAVDDDGAGEAIRVDPDAIRGDLAESLARHALTLDAARPEAVRKRHALGYRMPRENIDDLLDADSFREYWPLLVARQHRRRSPEELREQTPADGLVAGTGTINAAEFGAEAARAMVVHYDYTVLAGTQGARNHYKQDRLFDLAERFRLPVVLFGEGGGGRPGDDSTGPAVAFDTDTFTTYARLSGLVPLVAIVNGRCFAGNTALVACSDIIIATEGSTLGMGGPAMIEGGGLGVYRPEEVGPMRFQVPNGVVDLLVEDEAAAVKAARQYLGYFQGRTASWEAPDQRALRHVVPENRLRLYDMREIIETIADTGSVLELRCAFGVGVITAFIRVEGRPVGVIANNPHHLAGAIDSPGADKGARFLQLCDAFDIPVLSLMDCPGMMVGPEVEETALVRHCTRMFNVGANLTTPLFGVIVRKAYGLGVQAMCGGSAQVGFFTIAWPTAEFAGMNIEGSVKLGYRRELAAIEDPQERREAFDARVERAYDSAKAVNAAAGGGVDDVIDPAETRRWLVAGLERVPAPPSRAGKKYAFIDTW
ncbi:MAG: carboxyl transferase domain-containing protein [Pseudomonadota bacterium]